MTKRSAVEAFFCKTTKMAAAGVERSVESAVKPTGRYIYSKRRTTTLLDKKDVFAELPTGFGKSLIFGHTLRCSDWFVGQLRPFWSVDNDPWKPKIN